MRAAYFKSRSKSYLILHFFEWFFVREKYVKCLRSQFDESMIRCVLHFEYPKQWIKKKQSEVQWNAFEPIKNNERNRQNRFSDCRVKTNCLHFHSIDVYSIFVLFLDRAVSVSPRSTHKVRSVESTTTTTVAVAARQRRLFNFNRTSIGHSFTWTAPLSVSVNRPRTHSILSSQYRYSIRDGCGIVAVYARRHNMHCIVLNISHFNFRLVHS